MQTLDELQTNSVKRELELETQVREAKVETHQRDMRLVQSQPMTK